ncbi:hypothetical protein P152DRAFT_403920 [Eremomyces bilateralis CBS 781.70]|uniref:PX domain-containing protein n=1 Tax=Eremomyces bilateralis CBS 781.70 TaxID=1392243 RepID=A0A6G1FTU0_9PEZI|nr:uncharacterized protein P152DRAFT_403920 [Eremomyces bilateralis CBS 781.70]KAF1809173.1 hypothetical protein P152DRAFT_403920 [Eremomyces bilateralis CBS 781.70]
MWDDEEDNNPYGSFAQREPAPLPTHPDSPEGTNSAVATYNAFDNANMSPEAFHTHGTPPSSSPEAQQEPPDYGSHSLSDVDYNDTEAGRDPIEPKKGGYDSRIEQILYENPNLPIIITTAGKNVESGGSYIAYAIRTGDLEVRRRYSEFASLRQTIVNLHPTLIIPPIPEKHSMADYAAKPTKAKEDAGIIELRKRMLSVFLNRCRRMKEVREDGVWWRFLDPNASWLIDLLQSEVMRTPPVSNLPKNILKSPPLDAANPSPGHNYLPIPSVSAKLRVSGSNANTGTPTSPSSYDEQPSTVAHTIPGPQVGRFPPSSQNLSEEELDPYFVNFEASSKELELLLQGSMEKVNRRTLAHYSSLADDMAELGARYNAFSLSEQSQGLAVAIEKVGQAADATFVATTELSSSLSAEFAEPMRESAQFAGVVRNVLRYRVLKRIQQEMTRDELEKKRLHLDNLERSEMESQRLNHYLEGAGPSSGTRQKRSFSSGSASSRGRTDNAETASIDSDFPPTHGDSPPTSRQGGPQGNESPAHRKSQSGGFMASTFGRIGHAWQGFTDANPERNRRDQIGKTKESLVQASASNSGKWFFSLTVIKLEQALVVSEKDVGDASSGVLKDLKRFQSEKEEDLKRYMTNRFPQIAFARCHIDWARRSQAAWEQAKNEVENIEVTEGG